MTRFVDGPEVEVSGVIHAPPDVVWRLVTDINIPARFQNEFLEAEWLDDGPALEARFIGRNQRGTRSWETTSWIVTYEPMEAFGWAVSDRNHPAATWTYSLEDLGESTRLRYHRKVGPGPSGLTAVIDKYPDREEEFIAARDEEHRLHMQAVVDGIKALAEQD
jgi:uncharacterized protein YndB with AHSA1/START domain